MPGKAEDEPHIKTSRLVGSGPKALAYRRRGCAQARCKSKQDCFLHLRPRGRSWSSLPLCSDRSPHCRRYEVLLHLTLTRRWYSTPAPRISPLRSSMHQPHGQLAGQRLSHSPPSAFASICLTSSAIWPAGGNPGTFAAGSGFLPSAMAAQRWVTRSTHSWPVKTQNLSAETASATRSATSAGVIACSMACRTYGSTISLPIAEGGCSPRLAGQLRDASMMLVRTQPGHSTLTPTGRPANVIDR